MPIPLHTALHAFTQGLRSLGIRKVVVSPGSRNAAVLQALNEEDFELHSVVDERSAGFVAMGMAQADQTPVAVLCTSGTAVLNYSPSVAESFYSNTPLVVISADRPKALIDNWTGQCIRQENVFGAHIRQYVSMPESTADVDAFFEKTVALQKSLHGPDRGPVHINFPIAEPFYHHPWDPDRRDYNAAQLPEQSTPSYSERVEELKEAVNSKKVLVVGGFGTPSDLSLPNGIPFLKDVLVPHHNSDLLAWDAFLSSSSSKKMFQPLQPEVLLTFGKYCVSKGLRQFLRANKPKRHFHINSSGELGDPFETEPVHIRLEPSELKHLFDALPPHSEYAESWSNTLSIYQNRLSILLHDDRFNEFSAARTIMQNTAGTLHLGNSMPVRYASFLDDHHNKRYFGNRGTSGIDGCLSTAVGHAAASGEAQTLLIGDLSFFYDINGLWNELDHKLRIVILNNRGGGIFDFIKGPEALGEARKFQSTPHTRTAERVAADFGLDYFPIDDLSTLDEVMKREIKQTEILEVFTDPNVNARIYGQFKEL